MVNHTTGVQRYNARMSKIYEGAVALRDATKFVPVDFNNLKSMKSAEMRKARLETKGYKLVHISQNGFNKFNMVYQTTPKRTQ